MDLLSNLADKISLLVVLSLLFQAVEANDDHFWDQFWSESAASISDVFTLIPASEIRNLRDENPTNLATLCCKVKAFLFCVDISWGKIQTVILTHISFDIEKPSTSSRKLKLGIFSA